MNRKRLRIGIPFRRIIVFAMINVFVAFSGIAMAHPAFLPAAPILVNPIQNMEVDEGFGTETIDISGVFEDPDGDPLIYSALSSNTGIARVSIDGDSLIITEGWVGYVTITVSASDGTQSIFDQFTFRINDINSPPILLYGADDLNLTEHFDSVLVDLNPVFYDPEGDPLSYSAESENTEIATVSVIGKTLIVYEAGLGSTSITIYASDGEFTNSDTFTLYIQDVNDPPILISNTDTIHLVENFGSEIIDLNEIFSDQDGDDLSFTASSGNEGIVKLTLTDSFLSLEGLAIGKAEIIITASDGQDVVRDSIMVIVSPENSLSLTYRSRELFSNDTIVLCNDAGEVDLLVYSTIRYYYSTPSPWMFLEVRGPNTLVLSYADNLYGYREGEFLINDSQGHEIRIIVIQSSECNVGTARLIALPDLSVYPNPVGEFLYITGLESINKVSAQIISLEGKIVHSPQNVSQNEGINIRTLQEGLYILKIQIGDEYIYKRFVKY